MRDERERRARRLGGRYRDEARERDAAARVASASIAAREIASTPESGRRRAATLDRLDRETIAVAAIARRESELATRGESIGRAARELVAIAVDIAIDPASEIELDGDESREVAGRLSTASERRDERLDAIVSAIVGELVATAIGERLERLDRPGRPR